ncbi:MAG: chorismate-binding protein [Hymenobacteraceae bacterium]|nr:chorismate-binding protein [Hymenobacteraceae bacterium]
MGEETRQYSLEQVYSAAIAQRLAIAVWRLPNSDKVQACVSLQEQLTVGQPELEESAFGFLFCPFQPSERHQNSFIRADLFFEDGTGLLTSASDAPQATRETFYTALEQGNPVAWHTPSAGASQASQTEAGFTGAVALAVEAIRNEEMEKVVLSRTDHKELPESFSPVAALRDMLQEYPRAFVSLVSVPGTGTWMGASPEILVSINQEQVFHTVALAGTQPAVDNVADAIWRQKEIEEQAMVERYILNCFKSLRLREYTEIGPRTVIAGNLMHLRTDFKVDLKEVDFPRLGSDMLQLLHPTSAVCGLPKAPAQAFILEQEGYDRSYYSGYLGPVNSATGTHIFVNLRCMELLQRHAILYAGAGITAESSPEKEWQETQHKMQTMGKILAGCKQI